MKRKYLSALLMGVLTLSSVSTFTSCKDYDDDISNLQEQIDKLATADQLSQKVSELQALISSNKSDITSLQSELAKKTTLDEVKAVLADYATKEYVDGADATLKAAIDALETGKVAELEAAVKAAQAAADKAAADAEKANAEIVETLKTLATKAEVEEVQNAANTAIAAVESKNAEALEKAQAAILETLKGYATTQDLKEVADAADKALKVAQAEQAAKDEAAKKAADKALSDAVAALNTAIGNAQTKANTAATDASKALADLVTTTKTANDAKKLADENKQSVADALKLLGEGYSAENTVAAAIKAIQAQVGTPNKELGTLDTRLAAIESVLNGVKDDDTKLGLATKVTNIENKLKDIIGEYTTMVTEVSLLGSYVNGALAPLGKTALQFTSGTVGKNITFGKEEKASANYQVPAAENQKTFVEGTTFNTKSELVVRVNPVNAVLTKAAIKLVDSKGNNLDNILEIGEPKPFDKLLTDTRAANNTGLWTIPVTVKADVPASKIAQLTEVDGVDKHILYAVAVNNTSSEAAKDRYVTSTYDITVPKADKFEEASNINNVKIKSVNTMAAPITLGAAMRKAGDTTGEIVPAKSGEDITIDFSEYSDTIQYFYVVRDDSNVDGGSGSSAINAWKSYEYGGSAYGKVVEVNPAEKKPTLNIKINGQKGDKIGFRIFAIHYNGKVKPQYGESFVVYVGENENQASVKGNLVAVSPNDNETDWLPLTGTLKDGNATTVDFAGDFTKDGVTFTAQFAKDADGHAAAKNSEIKYVKFKTTTPITSWKDDATISYTIIQKDGNNMVKNQVAVSLTKKLPTAETTKALYGYTWKDAQLVNGKYTAYVTPTTSWTSANAVSGYQKFTQAITGLKDGFEITVEGVKKKNGKYTEPDTYKTDGWKVTVDKALIDGTTEHKTTISYNYGTVSSETYNTQTQTFDDYTVPVETIQTVFACPLTKKDQSYAWAQHKVGEDANHNAIMADVNYLTYGSNNTVNIGTANAPKYANLLDFIIGTNKYYNNEFGGSLNTLVYGANAKYAGIHLELLSAGSGQEDYFHPEIATMPATSDTPAYKYIKFTQKSNTSNPVADVKSWLVIKLTDAFGCDQTYKLPFTVKKAQ